MLATLAAALVAVTAAEDPPRGEVRIAVFGDFNGPYGSTTYPPLVSRAMQVVVEEWRPDLLLSPGDVIAGQSSALGEAELDEMWAAFDVHVAQRLRAAGIPYAVALGNHDGSSLRDRSGGYLYARDRDAAARYWNAPLYQSNLRYLDRSRYPFDFSFVFGELAVIVIDASSAHLSHAQREWLARELESGEVRRATMSVVVGHLPLLPVSQGRDKPGEYLADGRGLAEELRAAGVDLYVSGHHAAYYAGTVGEMEALFAGGVGGRALLAGGEPPRSTITLVDVWFEPLSITYTTFDLATMQVVAHESLPEAIESPAGRVELSSRVPRTLTSASPR